MTIPDPDPAGMQQHSKAHQNLANKGELLNAPSVPSHNSVTTDQSAHDSQTSNTNLDNAPLKMELKEIPDDKTRKLSDIKILTQNDFIQSSLPLPSFLGAQNGEEPSTKIKRTLEFLFGVPFFKIQDNDEADFYCRHFNTKCCIVREHLLFANGCYDPSSDEGMDLISCAVISFLNAHPELKKISEGLVKKHESEIQAEIMNQLPLFGLIEEGMDQWRKAKEESTGFDHLWMLIFNWGNNASKRGEESRNAFKMIENAALQDKIETGSKLENGMNFQNEFQKQMRTTYKKKELEDANTNILWMLVVVPLSRLLNDKDTPPFKLFTADDHLWIYRVRYQNYIDQLEEGVKDAQSDNPDFHLRESLSRFQTCINMVNEDKKEYLNPDYYTKWREKYSILCWRLSQERYYAEKNSKDSLVKGYGEKYGGVYHDIQDNIQNGKIAGFITELVISIAAGGAASMVAKGFMKAAGKSVLRTLVRQAGVDITTNIYVAESGQVLAILSDATMNDDVKMNSDYWLKQAYTVRDNVESSTISGVASAGISTTKGLASGELHWKNSDIAQDSPAVKAHETPPPLPDAAKEVASRAPKTPPPLPDAAKKVASRAPKTPPPLPDAAKEVAGNAPVKAETKTPSKTDSATLDKPAHTYTEDEIDDMVGKAREAMNGGRTPNKQVTNQVDNDIDDVVNKVRRDMGKGNKNATDIAAGTPPPLPDAAKKVASRAHGTPPPLPDAAKKVASRAPKTPPPLPDAAKEVAGNAPVKERFIIRFLEEIMASAPLTSIIVTANRMMPSPTNEPPKPDPYFIDRYKKMIEPLKDKSNRADNSEDKNEDAEVSDQTSDFSEMIDNLKYLVLD